MSSLVEQTLVLELRIANAILDGTADTHACTCALSAQADQVSSELRAAEAGFDATPDEEGLRRIVAARAAFCGQVAGERLLEAFVKQGGSGMEAALDAFQTTANAIVRYLNDRANGDEAGAVAAVERACTMLPPDRRAMLGR
jgi:hypothetical protein